MSAEQNRKLEFRTKEFALQVIGLYSKLPKTTVAQVLGRQILRSGTSVGAQYREAKRAKSRADFVSKIEGSLQEIEETCYWLDLLVESDTITEKEVASVTNEARELTAMLAASVLTAKRKVS